jgi:RecA/RadA recombinase
VGIAPIGSTSDGSPVVADRLGSLTKSNICSIMTAMATLSPDVSAAVASLQARWGAAAPRVVGALATAPLPEEAVEEREQPLTGVERVVRTGFPELDAILGPGGLPRSASVALTGAPSSGATTLALRLAAEAQADGAIVAWLDLARALDPVEAVARGVRLDWLVVLTPEDLDEGLSIAGMLLAGRSVDVLVIDLPTRPALAAGTKLGQVADRIRRLAALARRSETLLTVLEPPGLTSGLATAVAESTGLRLELRRRVWIRLGRDIVGQATEALVARNRHGPPGRRATLRILYAEGGERDRCLTRPDLLRDEIVVAEPAPAATSAAPTGHPSRISTDASPPPLLAASPAPARSIPPLRLVPDRPADRARRPALDRRDGRRRRSDGPSSRRPARDPARERPPART